MDTVDLGYGVGEEQYALDRHNQCEALPSSFVIILYGKGAEDGRLVVP